MQTVADMRGVGVKNRGKIADVLYGRPLTSLIRLVTFYIIIQEQQQLRTVAVNTHGQKEPRFLELKKVKRERDNLLLSHSII